MKYARYRITSYGDLYVMERSVVRRFLWWRWEHWEYVRDCHGRIVFAGLEATVAAMQRARHSTMGVEPRWKDGPQ